MSSLNCSFLYTATTEWQDGGHERYLRGFGVPEATAASGSCGPLFDAESVEVQSCQVLFEGADEDED